MSKKKRMEDILSLINEFEIETQEELTEKLNQKGYNVSQATVSRDIKDLGIVKSTGFSKKNRFVKFTAGEMPAKYVNMYKHAVISITAANNLIVIKTLEGNANSVGAAIDSMLFPAFYSLRILLLTLLSVPFLFLCLLVLFSLTFFSPHFSNTC